MLQQAKARAAKGGMAAASDGAAGQGDPLSRADLGGGNPVARCAAHDIPFVVTSVDGGGGAVLAGPTPISADLPALSGHAMTRARGETRKTQTSAPVTATTAAWLVIGRDVRGSFTRLGD